ncbi:MAG: signal peptidase I [Clostridia bacterium]|nr:signal peptidase I [Clostridia bacterium]
MLALVLCFTAVVAVEVVRFTLTRDYVMTSGNGVPTLFGYTVFQAQTDSMYPEFSSGAYLIGDPDFDPADLRPGDIITYWTVIGGERVLNTHRIINVYDGGNYLIFETNGDNNTTSDPLTVHEREIVSVYKFSFGG